MLQTGVLWVMGELESRTHKLIWRVPGFLRSFDMSVGTIVMIERCSYTSSKAKPWACHVFAPSGLHTRS